MHINDVDVWISIFPIFFHAIQMDVDVESNGFNDNHIRK